jgi:hypothetical protein
MRRSSTAAQPIADPLRRIVRLQIARPKLGERLHARQKASAVSSRAACRCAR